MRPLGSRNVCLKLTFAVGALLRLLLLIQSVATLDLTLIVAKIH